MEFRDRDEKRREDIPAHSHTLTARRETFNDAWGAPGQAQYVGKMLVLRDDWQKVLLTLLEGRVFNLDSVSHLVKHLECWLDIGAASWKSKVETISSCCKKEREGRASLS